MATGAGGPVLPIHALGRLEPLGIRYLDLIANQIDAIAATSAAAGRLTTAQLDRLKATVASAVDALKATETPGLRCRAGPGGLSSRERTAEVHSCN